MELDEESCPTDFVEEMEEEIQSSLLVVEFRDEMEVEIPATVESVLHGFQIDRICQTPELMKRCLIAVF